MKNILVCLMAILLLLAGCAGNPAIARASLGQKFSLAIGQSAEITGEDLAVGFKDVVEDSRCPKNVTCIWAGRAICIVEIRQAGQTEQTVLTEPGLTFDAVGQQYRNYTFAFRIEPYPETGKKIEKDDYRLVLSVSKK